MSSRCRTQAELGLTVGNYDRLDGNVSVDGALGESLFGSLSYHTANSDGWSESLVTGQSLYVAAPPRQYGGGVTFRW